VARHVDIDWSKLSKRTKHAKWLKVRGPKL